MVPSRLLIGFDECGQRPGVSQFDQSKVCTLDHLYTAVGQSREMVPSCAREIDPEVGKPGKLQSEPRVAARHSEFAVFVLADIECGKFDDDVRCQKLVPGAVFAAS